MVSSLAFIGLFPFEVEFIVANGFVHGSKGVGTESLSPAKAISCSAFRKANNNRKAKQDVALFQTRTTLLLPAIPF